MIVDDFLKWLYNLISTLWAYVPAWNLTVDTAAVASFCGYVHSWDLVSPVHEIMIVINIAFVLFLCLLGFKVVVKIIDWIRG